MDEDYAPTQLVSILHAVPHLSFKFVLLSNQTFSLDDEKYLESLAIIALMPIVILVLTMFGFLIYFCCVGIKRPAPNKNNSSACYCSVCLMVVFIMLALGGVSVVIYGSVQAHEGVSAASQATTDISQSFSVITHDVNEVNILIDDVNVQAEKLLKHFVNDSDVEMLYASVTSLLTISGDLPKQDEGADDRLHWTISVFEQTEQYRTRITFSLVGFHGLVCVLAVVGICCRSKIFLFATTFIGLICLVVSYLYIGSLFMVDVAISDLCMDPYVFIMEESVEKLYMDNATATYYLQCSHEANAFDPYKEVLMQIKGDVASISKGIMDVGTRNKDVSSAGLILDQLYVKTQQLSKVLKSLETHLNCKKVHAALKEFVPAVCELTLEGFFIVTIAVLCVCFAFTALLCAAPKTWKRFRKAKGRDEMDLDDVFLPTPSTRPAVSRTNNPLYNPPAGRYSARIGSNTNPPPAATNTLSFFRRSEEDVTLLDQPPPEYSPPRPGSEL